MSAPAPVVDASAGAADRAVSWYAALDADGAAAVRPVTSGPLGAWLVGAAAVATAARFGHVDDEDEQEGEDDRERARHPAAGRRRTYCCAKKRGQPLSD